jgi:phospholipid/cholesterol/gamma-HCH transport system substrate-binding protein
MSRRTEIEVGLTVLVALVTVLWGVTWLKEMSLTRRLTVWHVRFPQTGGLGQSDEVQVNGIRKGDVKHIDLVGDHVIVDLALAHEVRLTTDSRVAIRNVGLMGDKVIAVDLASAGPARSPRDTIEGIYELGIPEVVANLGGTFTTIDSLATDLGAIAHELRGNGQLAVTMENLRTTSEQLRDAIHENRQQLRETVSNATSVTSTMRELTTERADQYRQTLDAAEKTAKNMEALSARLDSLRVTAQAVTNKLDTGDGTAARLINDRQLYEDMRATMKSMQDLLEDFKKHPKKYVNFHVF